MGGRNSAPGNAYRTVVLALVGGRWRQPEGRDPSGLGNWFGAYRRQVPMCSPPVLEDTTNPAVATTLVARLAGSARGVRYRL